MFEVWGGARGAAQNPDGRGILTQKVAVKLSRTTLPHTSF